MATPTKVQTLRSSTTGNRPPNTRLPGELYTNWADRQIGVMDSGSNAMDLVAVRFFSATANYNVGDHVLQSGILYRAIVAITAGPFNIAQWAPAGGGVTMSDTAPATPNVGQLWYDTTGGQLYVWYNDGTSSQWVIAVNQNITGQYLPLTGGTLSGPLAVQPSSSVVTAQFSAPGATLFSGAVGAGAANVVINKSGNFGANLNGTNNGSMRWSLNIGNSATEGSGNVGSDFAINRFDNTGAGIDSPLVISRANGAVTLLDGIAGVTNGSNALAGCVGEFLSNYSGGIIPVSGTPINITGTTLTPGDWDIWADFVTGPGATTTTSSLYCVISTTSGSLAAVPGAILVMGTPATAGTQYAFTVGPTRVNITASTAYYVVMQMVFAVSTMNLQGNIFARRRR